MSKKNYRYMVFISSIVLLSLVLAACGGAKEAPITVPAGAQAGDLVGLEPCTYEAGDVEYAADCGTLVVPENRSDPDSRLIALPVIRVHALSDTPAEPIFYFVGGPGASNMHFQYLEGLVENHDFVQVGYRGIDGSVSLDCPDVDKTLKKSDDLLSDTTLDNFAASTAQCAARLQNEGFAIDGYTLPARVDDSEAARAALGYRRINLLGGSVGSRTAQFYAWMYPDSIHRSVIYSINPPGGFIWEPEVVDEQLEYYARLCAKDVECSSRTDDLAETMRTVARDMPHRWLFLPIKSGNVKLATFWGLMHASTDPLSAPLMFDVWLAAAEGDASGLALMSLIADMIFPTSFVWGETAAVGISADHDPARDYRADMNPPDSIIGSPGTLWLWSGLSAWPTEFIPAELRQVQPSDVETLLVSGSIDFSTPARYATEELLPSLSNGQRVILSEFGHSEDFWSLQPEARVRLLTSFYDTGVADDSLYTYHPVDFHVGFGFPEQAKLALAVVVLVPLLLVALVWFIVRRVRRRRVGQVSS